MNSGSIYDVIVVGGSMAGCFAALHAAKRGSSVLLIESRTYLGREFTSTLRPWISIRGIDNVDQHVIDLLGIQEIADTYMGRHIESHIETPMGSDVELPLKAGYIKKSLLGKLRQAGVQVLFMSGAVGVLAIEERIAGVVIANKSGLQAMTSRAVIDATENQVLTQFSGGERKPALPSQTCSWTIEFSSVMGRDSPVIELPHHLGVSSLTLHQGSRGEGHVLAEVSFETNVATADYNEKMSWEIEARMKTIQICEYLKNNVSGFQDAVLLRASDELWHASIWQPAPSSLENLIAFHTNDWLVEHQDLHTLAEIWRLTEGSITSFYDKPQQQVSSGITSVNNVMVHMDNLKLRFDEFDPILKRDSSLKINYYSLSLNKKDIIPYIGKCDVLVAGGGTAGAPAAIGALNNGAQVMVLDGQSGLGGTGTLGGINVYWYGYKEGYTAELDAQVEAMTMRISKAVKGKLWNIEAKKMVYLEEIAKQNGLILFRTLIVDVWMEARKIKGIVVATPYGLGMVQADIVIDATGDGDVAAYAGVPFALGEERGGNLQTFNLCDWKVAGALAGVNLDLGVIDPTNTFDTTRGLYAGHESGSDYDFSTYPAVREARHIQGRYRLTVADVLSGRGFEDAVAIGSTDFDQHGLQSSEFARLGYLPYHQDCKFASIPYRACIPEGIDNLLVAGKAFSAEREAFSFIRMQPDLQNMGYSLGLSAAQAIEEKVNIPDIHIADLQKKLVLKKIIREEDVNAPLRHPVEARLSDCGDAQMFLRVITSPKERMTSLLKKSFTEPEYAHTRHSIAMALAWFGEADGIELLIDEMKSLRHEEQQDTIDKAGRPVGGFVGQPDTHWKMNQLITLLGIAGDPRAAELLIELAAETDAGGSPRPHARLHWRRVPNYDRIICLCFSIERVATFQAIPALQSLLEKQHLSGHLAKHDKDADKGYASAYLELVIARTLAKCGGGNGLHVLANYLKDVRAVLSDHAHSELVRIANVDFGKNVGLWTEWINKHAPIKA
jgi:flavin-dependent dehydrogenase